MVLGNVAPHEQSRLEIFPVSMLSGVCMILNGQEVRLV